MERRFSHHFTREEAQALLPQVRTWLRRLQEIPPILDHVALSLVPESAAGHDLGGDHVVRQVRLAAEFQSILGEFQRRQIQIKDVARGLVDFPALIAGREVFLCWEQDEETIEYWHDIDSGYMGRHPL